MSLQYCSLLSSVYLVVKICAPLSLQYYKEMSDDEQQVYRPVHL